MSDDDPPELAPEPPKWFYAVRNEQKGPVSGAAMMALFTGGTLGQNSLVWREGMDGWKPYSSVASQVQATAEAEARAGGAAPSDFVTCSYSGEAHPKSEMLRYGDQWVLAEHKDAFVRALEQGRLVDGTAPVTSMEFVGFWWRVLSRFIDWVVTSALTLVALIPLIVVGWIFLMQLFSSGGDLDPAQVGGGAIAALVIGALLSALLVLALNAGYHTWMVGKYQATLGKMALGFIVVNRDGSRVSYLKAFGRVCAEMLHKVAASIAMMFIGAAITVGGLGVSGGDESSPAFMVLQLVSGVLQVFGGYVGYYVAGWTKEKTAVHDMICSTRVVRK